MGKIDAIEVRLLSYNFRFKRLTWREESQIKKEGDNPIRAILSMALQEISGLEPGSVKEARRVINAIPEAIVTRVWKVYRGSLPPARRFSTANLYQAPEPLAHMDQVQEEEEITESAHDRVIREMENRFGKQEVAEEAELNRKIMEAAKKNNRFAGAGPATPDGRENVG